MYGPVYAIALLGYSVYQWNVNIFSGKKTTFWIIHYQKASGLFLLNHPYFMIKDGAKPALERKYGIFPSIFWNL